jgi:Flp pilus assembly protein TadG
MLDIFGSFFHNRQGNIALSFALLAVPLLVAVGASFDFMQSFNARRDMQVDLDAAVLAAMRDVDTLSEAKLREKVKQWFAAQSELQTTQYTLVDAGITIDKTNRTIRAEATGTVATSLLRVANIRSVDVSVKTTVAGPASSYLNVYVLLDKSASMMLAATTADQQKMKTYAGGCVFACHTPEGDHDYNGRTYSNNYDLAKALGVTLRADVSVSAVGKVLDVIASEDPQQKRIKIGFYTMGTSAIQAQAPTNSISTARQALTNDAKGLTSATSFGSTYFHTALPQLADFVGTAGDGSSAQKPLKLVLLLTDGVQSARDWVHNDQDRTTPLNPDWCDDMKDAGADVAVLYTEYLPITWDWGYVATVGAKMKTSDYASVWKGKMPTGSNTEILRRDFIPYALKDCASKPNLFLSAANADDIETGLSALFREYLAMVRLTQ